MCDYSSYIYLVTQLQNPNHENPRGHNSERLLKLHLVFNVTKLVGYSCFSAQPVLSPLLFSLYTEPVLDVVFRTSVS